MLRLKFNYNYLNGWVNVNTLSPSEKYYYKLQHPVELNRSAFGAKLAFFSIENEVLYYRSGFYAHELHSNEEIGVMKELFNAGKFDLMKSQNNIEFVKWSVEGNMAFFCEYMASNTGNSYENIFVHLGDKICFRINDFDSFIINKIRPIDQKFHEHEVLNFMEEFGYTKEPLIVDRINKLPLFGGKWFPRLDL